MLPSPTPVPAIIPCADGVQLSAELWMPDGPVRGVVQLNPATGATRAYYWPFAQFLAGHGFAVCLYDYRGSGGSAPLSLRGCTYRFLDYGTLDMPAVLDWLDAHFAGLPKYVVGHSVGGQQVGFMPNHRKIKGMVTMASATGYWGYMPLGYRLKTHFFFHLFSPLSHALAGYNAGRRFGIMEDLPRRVVTEWRAWCSVPDYFFDPRFFGKTVPSGFFDALTFPIRVYWATDDPIANRESVPRFWHHVRSTNGIELVRLTPAQVDAPAIEHFGFFRRAFANTIWQMILNDLAVMEHE